MSEVAGAWPANAAVAKYQLHAAAHSHDPCPPSPSQPTSIEETTWGRARGWEGKGCSCGLGSQVSTAGVPVKSSCPASAPRVLSKQVLLQHRPPPRPLGAAPPSTHPPTTGSCRWSSPRQGMGLEGAEDSRPLRCAYMNSQDMPSTWAGEGWRQGGRVSKAACGGHLKGSDAPGRAKGAAAARAQPLPCRTRQRSLPGCPGGRGWQRRWRVQAAPEELGLQSLDLNRQWLRLAQAGRMCQCCCLLHPRSVRRCEHRREP